MAKSVAEYQAMIEAAKRDGHPAFAPRERVRPTAEVFGQLMTATWAAKHGRGEFPHREKVVRALISNLETAPPEVRHVLHIDTQGVEPGVAEYSRYMTSAQMNGSIKRFNPDYERVSVELDRLTGVEICNILSYGLESTAKWLEGVLDSLESPGKAD